METSNSNPLYKPSPLSFGSQRTSPFRRQSTKSPPTSSTARASQPASPSSRGQTPTHSPSKLNQLHTAEDDDVFADSPSARKAQNNGKSPASAVDTAPQPTERPAVNNNKTLGKLPPAQLREMREAFQILDRDNDGQVNRDDVADVLVNLGQDSSSSATTPYFPPGDSQSISLPTFLNKIAAVCAPLSSGQELLNAFAAFDEDDSGQVDLAELRDTLLHTSPDDDGAPLTEQEIDEAIGEFSGKRAFGGRGVAKSGGSRNRGEVFRYQDFVGSITGRQGANGRTNGEPVEVAEG